TEWMKRHYSLSSDVSALLAEVKSLRQEMRARLERAPVSVWGHAGFNPYRGTRTLMWWVERSVAHVAEHIGQLANDQEAP
ncbi:MAG TPA: DinB family protein, partial [Anaerolineales bacterium]|nr:DinB family protein [Anaerolineales bacterium]